MRLGRESLILIAVPLVVMALAFALFIPRESLGVKDNAGDVSAQLDVDRPVSDRKYLPLTPWDSANSKPGATDQGPSLSDEREIEASSARDPNAPPPQSVGEANSSKGASANSDRGQVPDKAEDERDRDSADAPPPGFRKPWRGGLRDAQGNPIPGAVITVTERRNLFDSAGRPFEQVSVRESMPVGVEGAFEVTRRQGYVYVVNVAAAGYAAATIPLSAQPSSIITLRRPLRVVGRVIDASTQAPVAGVTVALFNDAGRQELPTRSDGEYSFDSVAPGNFFLEIGHPDFLPVRAIVRPVGQETLITRNFELTRGAQMTVHVIDGVSELPITDSLSISVFDRFRSLSAGQITTQDGDVAKFVSLHAGGTYGVTVTSNQFGTAYKEIQAPQSGGDFDITVQLNDPWTFQGIVSDDNGRPVPMARISLNGPSSSGEPSYVVFTNSEGVFSQSGLGRQLNFRVSVFHPDFAIKILPVVSNALLPAGEMVNISMTRAAKVEGVVKTAEGLPIPGALVRLRTDALIGSLVPSVPPSPAGSEGLFAYTDDDGSFLITGVPEGSASLTALAAGFRSGTVQVSVVGLDSPVIAPEILLISSQRIR